MTNALKSLSSNDLLVPNVDKTELIRDAIKTFQATYHGYQNMDTNTTHNYNKHKRQFFNSMEDMLETTGLDMN